MYASFSCLFLPSPCVPSLCLPPPPPPPRAFPPTLSFHWLVLLCALMHKVALSSHSSLPKSSNSAGIRAPCTLAQVFPGFLHPVPPYPPTCTHARTRKHTHTHAPIPTHTRARCVAGNEKKNNTNSNTMAATCTASSTPSLLGATAVVLRFRLCGPVPACAGPSAGAAAAAAASSAIQQQCRHHDAVRPGAPGWGHDHGRPR